jgi:hypothetical protein
LRPEPFEYQPNPGNPFFVQAKAKRLVRRERNRYVIEGTKPDGTQVEAHLTSVSFQMKGL